MKQEDIDFLTIRIDPKKEYGSLQAILSEGDLRTLSFDSVCKRLIVSMMNDRQALMKENRNMSNYLRKIGQYCEEAVFGEDK